MGAEQEVNEISQRIRGQSCLKKPRDGKGLTLYPRDKVLVNCLVG